MIHEKKELWIRDEHLKSNQKEILELKGIIIEKKNMSEGLTCRFEQMEKRKEVVNLKIRQ